MRIEFINGSKIFDEVKIILMTSPVRKDALKNQNFFWKMWLK